MSKADDPAWLRTQHTIRKLLHTLGKDALVYAQSALEKETSEPSGLRCSGKAPGSALTSMTPSRKRISGGAGRDGRIGREQICTA